MRKTLLFLAFALVALGTPLHAAARDAPDAAESAEAEEATSKPAAPEADRRILPGDFDFDGSASFRDAVKFAAALEDPQRFVLEQPWLTPSAMLALGDLNDDGRIGNADLVELLLAIDRRESLPDEIRPGSTAVTSASLLSYARSAQGSVEALQNPPGDAENAPGSAEASAETNDASSAPATGEQVADELAADEQTDDQASAPEATAPSRPRGGFVVWDGPSTPTPSARTEDRGVGSPVAGSGAAGGSSDESSGRSGPGVVSMGGTTGGGGGGAGGSLAGGVGGGGGGGGSAAATAGGAGGGGGGSTGPGQPSGTTTGSTQPSGKNNGFRLTNASAYNTKTSAANTADTGINEFNETEAAFPVFDALLHRGKPDLVHKYDMKNIKILYASDFWGPNQDRSQPIERNVRRLGWRLKPGQIVCVDIEHWKTSKRVPLREARQSVEKLRQVFTWLREEAPNSVKFGIWSQVPAADYWAPIKREMGKPTSHDRWLERNKWLVDQLGNQLDVVFPHAYTPYPRPKQWAFTTRANIREARKLGKPVYVFLWPAYADYGDPDVSLQPIPGAVWRKQLQLAYELADGIVLWGGYKQTWDKDAEWWLETKRFLDHLPN